jgi:hypothetical protein
LIDISISPEKKEYPFRGILRLGIKYYACVTNFISRADSPDQCETLFSEALKTIASPAGGGQTVHTA